MFCSLHSTPRVRISDATWDFNAFEGGLYCNDPEPRASISAHAFLNCSSGNNSGAGNPSEKQMMPGRTDNINASCIGFLAAYCVHDARMLSTCVSDLQASFI